MFEFKVDSLTMGYNKYTAKTHIQHGNIYLFISGGFGTNPTVDDSDRLFEKKYLIKFNIQGCITGLADNVGEFNQTIFEYLDKKYGTVWRKEIRTDVIGFNK